LVAAARAAIIFLFLKYDPDELKEAVEVYISIKVLQVEVPL